MRLELTIDVDQAVRQTLKDNCRELFKFDSDLEAILLSQAPPSWLYLIADVKEWIQPILMVGATAFITSFFAQLGKEFAQKLMQKRAKRIPSKENPHVQELDTLIKSISGTQKVLKERTSISIGVPIPGELSRGNISLGLSYDTDERLAFEISTFIQNILVLYSWCVPAVALSQIVGVSCLDKVVKPCAHGTVIVSVSV